MFTVDVKYVNTRKHNKRLQLAQKRLDTLVIKDSTRYIPIRGGALRNSANLNTVIGKGLIIWKTPYAHYQYIGKDMVGVVSGSHYAMRDESKVYNGQILHYREPEATSKWYEKAKQVHGDKWIKTVKEIVGNG